MTFLLAIVVSFAFGEESKKEKCPHGIKYRNIGNHFFQLGRKERRGKVLDTAPPASAEFLKKVSGRAFIFIHLMMFIMTTFLFCDSVSRKLFLNQS